MSTTNRTRTRQSRRQTPKPTPTPTLAKPANPADHDGLVVYAFLASEPIAEPYSELATPGRIIAARRLSFVGIDESVVATRLFDDIAGAFGQVVTYASGPDTDPFYAYDEKERS